MALNYKSSLARYRRYLDAAEKNQMWQAGIFVILSLGLILTMVVFALRPTLLTIADLVNQIEEQRALSQRLAQKIDTVRQASDAMANVRDRLVLLDQGLPRQPEWLSWVKSVEAMSTSSGVTIQSISAGPVKEAGASTSATAKSLNQTVSLPDGVERIDFTVVVQGEYEQARKFVEGLENIRRITNVGDVQYAKDTTGAIVTTVKGAVGYMPELKQP